MQNLTGNFTPKSFWERKEGLTGMILLGLVVIGVGAGLYALLPFLLVFLGSLIKLLGLLIGATIAAVGLFTIFGVLWRTRKLWSYIFMAISQMITNIFVSTAPLAIMKGYRTEVQNDIQEIDEKRKQLMGQENRLGRKVHDYNVARTAAIERARRSRSDDELSVHTREVARQDDLILKTQELLDISTGLATKIKKMRRSADLYVQDISGEINKREEEQATINPARSAVRSLAKIFGKSEGRELYDLADEYLITDYEMKKAEIQLYSENIQGALDMAELDQEILSDRGKEMLRQLDAQEGRLFTGKESPAAIDTSPLLGVNTGTETEEKSLGPSSKPQGVRYFDN